MSNKQLLITKLVTNHDELMTFNSNKELWCIFNGLTNKNDIDALSSLADEQLIFFKEVVFLTRSERIKCIFDSMFEYCTEVEIEFLLTEFNNFSRISNNRGNDDIYGFYCHVNNKYGNSYLSAMARIDYIIYELSMLRKDRSLVNVSNDLFSHFARIIEIPDILDNIFKDCTIEERIKKQTQTKYLIIYLDDSSEVNFYEINDSIFNQIKDDQLDMGVHSINILIDTGVLNV